MDIFCFLEKYLLVAVGEDASPSVDVVMGLVSVMVRVTGRTALWWGEGAKTGVKWPGTFPTTWPLLLGYKTKPKEFLVKQTLCLRNLPTYLRVFQNAHHCSTYLLECAVLTNLCTSTRAFHYAAEPSSDRYYVYKSSTFWWAFSLSGSSIYQTISKYSCCSYSGCEPY